MSMLKINKVSKERKMMLVKSVVVFAFPFFLCFIYCIIRGINIFNLYLPNSHNNDSLFYYKLVEGVLSGGIPKGYFGFNESRAMLGSFAAWSPALLLPWTLWGTLFGWGYSSVFISNIVYFALALVVFVYLTKLEWKNIIIILLVLALYPSLPIHLLSALPETVVSSIMIVFFGFAIKIEKEESKLWYIVIMYICSIYLTICRPYLAILIVLPCYFLIKKKVKYAYVYSIILFSIGLLLYYLCNHFFTSEYLYPLFDLSIVECVLEGRLSEAYWLSVVFVKQMFFDVGQFIRGAFEYGLTAGTQYVVALVVLIMLGVSCFSKKSQGQKITNSIFIFNLACVFIAIFLFLRKANEGGRHIWAFSIVGCILCFSYKFCKTSILTSGILISVLGFFCIQGSFVPTDYDVPIENEVLEDNVEYWQNRFVDRKIYVTDELSYDNTCVWVLTDDGEITNHKELYALPSGMGISCCTDEYVINNIDALKSRYIATIVEGSIDYQCKQRSYTEVGRTENVVIYQRY